MRFRFPSSEWCTAYQAAINENDGYAQAAAQWTHGSVAMIVRADAAAGIASDAAMLLDVHQGKCNDCRLVALEVAEAASFVIVGEYPQWKKVIKRELDPTKALMQGQLKLTKGHMPTMVKFVHASKQLVESSAGVPTQFPDE
jgi:putative sterol carrier protein